MRQSTGVRQGRCPLTRWCCRPTTLPTCRIVFYQVRCAAEDVATALDEGAGPAELRELCDVLISAARVADGWRRVGV